MEKPSAPRAASNPPKKHVVQSTGAPNVAQTASNEEDDAADVLLARNESVASDELEGGAPEAGSESSNPEAGAFALGKWTGKPSAAALAATRPGPVAQPAAPDPPAKPAPAAATAQKALGDYQLLKKLGQGGMGAVYLAHQKSLDRQVALKVLSKELAANPRFVERFKREARVMARLDHPNILRCFEVNEAMGYNYLAMELVDGGSLGDWLRKRGKLSLADSLFVVLACAHALQHAHELKIIHRDIKPDNILLKRGVVKVADLGLGKATDEDLDLTKTGVGAGTPLFMAPEQARDAKRVDHRSDIYALGCMLYLFLTGTTPFMGTTTLEVIEAKEKGKFKPARQTNAEIPERLDLMLDKMLTPRPEHRYQSCAQLILDLESLGLAGSQLSFIEVEGPPKQTYSPPPKKVSMPQMQSTPPSQSGPSDSADATTESYWYASYVARDGKSVTRKMTAQEIIGQIRNKAFDAETQLSKARKGGYRSLGTYAEFQHLIKATLTKEKAERKAEKFKAFYQQIDKQEKSRQRWRWLHNKFLGIGGFIGFLLWLAVIVAIGVGLYFAVIWLGPFLAEKLSLG
jgi:serine/threonine-protein kinase